MHLKVYCSFLILTICAHHDSLICETVRCLVEQSEHSDHHVALSFVQFPVDVAMVLIARYYLFESPLRKLQCA